MKGTEKQIAWAEDIIRNARGTVAANIKANTENAEKFARVPGSTAAAYYREQAAKWERLGAQLEKIFEVTDDAAKIIDKREMLDPRQLCNKWLEKA